MKDLPELYTLLAPVFNIKVSKRCGKGSCEFYNKHNKVSCEFRITKL